MNQERNQLFKEFEKEMWLYLDKDLPETRLKFWKLKLKEYPELKKYLEDYNNISEKYNWTTQFSISEEKLNQIIDKAVQKTSVWNKIKYFFNNVFGNEHEIAFGKIAFASVLIVAAILISVFTDRTNRVLKFTDTINSEILDWDGDYFENKIGNVSNLLKLIADDDYKKYSKYKLRSNDIGKNINLIENNIIELKREIINSEL